jgi:DnaJ-class molecular chaperone
MTIRDIEQSALENLCDTCGGEGFGRHECHPDRLRCSDCNGAGYVPTELGEKVLDLMRHNFRPMLQDVTTGMS